MFLGKKLSSEKLSLASVSFGQTPREFSGDFCENLLPEVIWDSTSR